MIAYLLLILLKSVQNAAPFTYLLENPFALPLDLVSLVVTARNIIIQATTTTNTCNNNTKH